jgi:AcrR family transcriptional regulator
VDQSEPSTDKKELIFRAALRLFNANGFDRTPTSQISREAGVATGTLFHYFETKEELINALYLRCKDSMLREVMAGFDKAVPFRAGLRRVYGNLIAWAINNSGEYLFFQQFSNSTLIGDKTRETGREKFGPLLDILDEGVRQDLIKTVQPDYLLYLISGMVMSTTGYLLDHPEKQRDEGFLEQSFGMLWDSIRQ